MTSRARGSEASPSGKQAKAFRRGRSWPGRPLGRGLFHGPRSALAARAAPRPLLSSWRREGGEQG
eukprot:8574508-Alexandrium_andersonii.AAC.1